MGRGESGLREWSAKLMEETTLCLHGKAKGLVDMWFGYVYSEPM